MYAVMFLWVVFYDFIEAHVPYVNYWDELTLFLVLGWGAWSFWKNPKLQKQDWIDWGCLAALVVIGALGNLVHPGLQEAKVALLKDVIALVKFPVIFFVFSRRSVAPEEQEKIVACMAKISRWILLVTPVLLLVGWFVDLGFYTDDVRILPSCTFIFTNPTFFISAYVMIAAALIAESINKNRLFLLLDCVLIFMAQRTKAYIFIVFLVAMIIIGEKWTTKILTLIFGSGEEKVKIGRLLLAVAVFGVVIYVVGKPRLEQQFNAPVPIPRTTLMVVGVKILMDYFPLGSGFGTFASYLSGKYYSNVYELYGIANVMGMNRESYNFISDVFWPYIYGQFGIFGLLIYVKLIFSIFIRQFHSRISEGARLSVAVVWVYALIATTGEAYFTNGTGVQMALMLSLLIGYGDRKTATSQRITTS